MGEAADFAGTIPVREQHRIDVAALTRWLEQNVSGFAGPLTVAARIAD